MEKKRVVLLGATGSIGQNSCAILSANTDRYETVAVAARSSLDALADAAVKLNAKIALTTDTAHESELASKLPTGIRAASGMDELLNIVTAGEVDIVVCAIIGTAGIKPVLAAIEAGKTIALASKEVMVAAGDLVNAALKANPQAKLLPVDSEHSGVFQCLEGRRTDEVDTIWLTASGGPFRTWSAEKIANATVAEALAHPTWSMGRKITIDSASMMNKALELVEARYLFAKYNAKLDVLVHPQSAVHALIELTDGSLIAQCGYPDMKLPIAYALSYPERLPFPGERLSLAKLGTMEFFAPDRKKFPAFDFADAALAQGGTLPCAMNAANEVAVERFCNGEINFGSIYRIIDRVMNDWHNEAQSSFAQLQEADREARRKANEVRL
ncbi:MAG: 1-deoxy-D-xylulose-5-phosphate reductoisomerase [Lentisphaeria bacterium]|nr:1-deoxy-D-xylulose-5-phosphate reductoisomerase [Lentisphaeria bacterium]